jgi:hypothetical protein
MGLTTGVLYVYRVSIYKLKQNSRFKTRVLQTSQFHRTSVAYQILYMYSSANEFFLKCYLTNRAAMKHQMLVS